MNDIVTFLTIGAFGLTCVAFGASLAELIHWMKRGRNR